MSMSSFVGVGSNSDVGSQVDRTHQASRVSQRPLEHSFNGQIGAHLALTCSYSNTPAKPAAGSDVLSLRWTDSKILFALYRLSVWVATTTPYTASAAQDLTLSRAVGFSVSPSAGTLIVPDLGGMQKLRTSTMSGTLLGGTGPVLQVSSGDLLTIGTRVLDRFPLGYMAYLNAITPVNPPSNGVLFDWRNFGNQPLILTVNEGLVIQTPIGNAQAAGVSKYTFCLEYAELPLY